MADDLNFSISLEEHVSDASHKASEALKELASELPGVAIGLIGVGVAMLAVAAAGRAVGPGGGVSDSPFMRKRSATAGGSATGLRGRRSR